MIVKHVAMRTVRKSSFLDLVRYMTDTQKNTVRIGGVSITNCHCEVLEDALAEIQAVQSCNTRSTDDKTYHLIVSFRAEEQPSNEMLRTIEDQVCRGLGYGDHQRVSAVHGDTDNLHVHIAINKIDPTRYTVHTPFNAYWRLARISERLEIEHGLQKDNHQAQKLGPENAVADMERRSGVQSLIGWVQAECLELITAASSWATLHETLGEHGLQLRERGNGFVIADDSGIQVKASSIDRSLAKAQLEKRLGPYEPVPQTPAGPQSHTADPPNLPKLSSPNARYDKKPFPSRIDTSDLYVAYLQERQAMSAARTAESRTLRQRQYAQLETIKVSSQVRRNAIRLIGGDRMARKVLYSLASRAMKTDLAKAREQHARERQVLQQQYVRRAWADWLQARAIKGDVVALKALRAPLGREGLMGDVLTGQGQGGDVPKPLPTHDHVTKKGTLIYRQGTSAIRDDGERLQIARDTDWQGLDAALRMAIQRYGRSITVAGTDDFKGRVIAAAAAAALPLTFSDPVLEQRRLVLTSNLSRKPNHVHSDRRRTNAGGVGFAQPSAAHTNLAPDPAARTGAAFRRPGFDVAAPAGNKPSAAGAVTPDTRRSTQRRKPDIGRPGGEPPPAAKNRLRNLSQLGVVQLARGGEVLLPGDVPDRLEQPDAQSDHALRRPVPGAARVIAADDAIKKFISERNSKRHFINDITKYERYTDANESIGTYAGTRSIDGQLLALLKRDDKVDVLPVDAATGLKLKRLRIGEAVTVQMRDQKQSIGGQKDSVDAPTYTFKARTRRTMTPKKGRSQ